MDARSELLLTDLHPTLVGYIRAADAAYRAATPGDYLELVQGLRNFSEQAALYAQGRTAPGEIVTQAPAGYSWHEFALAGDLVPHSLIAIPGWSPESPLWQIVTSIAEAHGLVCGSCWHHKDLPHMQLTGRFPVTPDDEVRALYASGGIPAVWAAAQIGEP